MRHLHLVFIVGLLSVAAPTSAQDWTSWQDFAVLDAGGDFNITLQWRVAEPSSLRSTRAQWRVLHNSVIAIYDVSIDNKTYVCSNGATVQASGEQVAGIMRPNTVESTLPDHLDKTTCPSITGAEFADAESILRYAAYRNGPVYPWGDYGDVRR